jgi:hypothetical protein
VGLFSKTDSERLERLDTKAENAFLRGRPGKGMRLAAENERLRISLENRTGRPWTSWGRPADD